MRRLLACSGSAATGVSRLMHFLVSPPMAALSALSTLVMLTLLAVPALAAPVKTPHVTAEIVAQRSAVQPGQVVPIGLRLQHIPHWHTYWRNPGDSGLPTTLAWTLPAGAAVGDILWPAPKRLPTGPLVNFGYEGELLLPMQFTAPADAAPGSTLNLRAKADWLVCKDVCIPETATLDLQLPVVDAQTKPGASVHEPLFARTAAESPVPWSGGSASLQHAGKDVLLTIDFQGAPPAADMAPAVHVFPYPEQMLEPARHALYRTPTGYAVRMALMDGATLPATLGGVLVAQGGAGAVPSVWGGPQRAVEFTAEVRAVAAVALPEGAREMSMPTVSPATADGTVGLSGALGATGVGVLAALVLALAGGALLNLMPCVFPVLSIKLLSLSQQGTDRRAMRAHALAYSGGVVLSFIALAGVLLALRAAGSAVGWGFQLQEPGVVFVLALLFFVLGLNLMGVFELGNLLPQRLASWRSERPAVDALASGVLAVVAASPCTAPFMGAALGFAVTQSAVMALTVFAALGVGMALPYALLVLLPGWRSRLPRPGAWMLTLKQGLAFPMFATVVWLVWVLGQQAGIDSAAQVLLALVGVAVLAWLAGLPGARAAAGTGARRGVVGQLVGVAALAGLLAWSWPSTLPGPGDGTASATGSTKAAETMAALWQPYDEAALAQRMSQGQPVFVDFTAAWCVSCQVNKRLVLHTDSTMQAFAQANVALMRADWTRRDESITQALARLGRNGVPVYALIVPGKEPLLLPEILTHGIIRDALATLNKQRS